MTPTRPSFPRGGLALVLGLVAFTGALALGQRGLWAPDEPKYALVAREMMETGEFLIPHVNGEPYPDKPPLLFWAIALTSRLTGSVGQPAAVLPSLLASLMALAGASFLAFELSGRASRLAPLVTVGLLAVSFRFAMQGVTGQIDMLLTACTTWAFLALVRGSETGKDSRSQGWTVAAFALMGLGTLAKGPVALILPLGGFLAGSWLSNRKVTWSRILGWRPILAFAGVVGAWLVPAGFHAVASGKAAWLTNILFRQTAVRFAASWHHEAPFWYFLTVPWYDFLPAILLFPGALGRLLRRQGEPGFRKSALLLAGACLFILVFFSIPRGKRGLYLMPFYPLLACWLGLDLGSRIEEGPRATRPVRVAGLVLGGLGFTAAALSWVILPSRLAHENITLNPSWLGVAFTLIGLSGFLLAWLPSLPKGLVLVGLAWAVFYGIGFRVVLPAVDPRKSAEGFIGQIEERVQPGTPGGMVDFRAQFGFHAGKLDAPPMTGEGLQHLADRLAGPDPFYLIVRENQLESIRKRLPPEWRPREIFRQPLGNNIYVVWANAAALEERGTHR